MDDYSEAIKKVSDTKLIKESKYLDRSLRTLNLTLEQAINAETRVGNEVRKIKNELHAFQVNKMLLSKEIKNRPGCW